MVIPCIGMEGANGNSNRKEQSQAGARRQTARGRNEQR